jgi:hypothetical protein
MSFSPIPPIDRPQRTAIMDTEQSQPGVDLADESVNLGLRNILGDSGTRVHLHLLYSLGHDDSQQTR